MTDRRTGTWFAHLTRFLLGYSNLMCMRAFRLMTDSTLHIISGPGKYDAVAEAHPMTQYTTGYNYPTSVKPEIVQACEEDTNCPASEVCSTGGYCRKWENGERWYFLLKKYILQLQLISQCFLQYCFPLCVFSKAECTAQRMQNLKDHVNPIFM